MTFATVSATCAWSGLRRYTVALERYTPRRKFCYVRVLRRVRVPSRFTPFGEMVDPGTVLRVPAWTVQVRGTLTVRAVRP